MPHKPGALLVAEIGNVTTRVTLVDLVDGEMRLIGQASVPSTTEPPFENAAARPTAINTVAAIRPRVASGASRQRRCRPAPFVDSSAIVTSSPAYAHPSVAAASRACALGACRNAI